MYMYTYMSLVGDVELHIECCAGAFGEPSHFITMIPTDH